MSPLQRKTQEERSLQTQNRLLDATISCLITDGYSAITTTKVCRLSGMSQGAIFKHYPTKNDLVTAAIAKLYDHLIDVFEYAIEGLPPEGDRIGVCLTALWALFDMPALLAVYDLHIAARTDPQFREALEPFERRHRQKIRDAAARIFPEFTENPRFFTAIDIILGVMQGAAVGKLALPEPELQIQRQEALELVARHFLEVTNECDQHL